VREHGVVVVVVVTCGYISANGKQKTHSNYFLVIPFGQLSTPMGSSSEVVGGERTGRGVVVVVVVVAGRLSGWWRHFSQLDVCQIFNRTIFGLGRFGRRRRWPWALCVPWVLCG
jgi:hypothetical protein